MPVATELSKSKQTGIRPLKKSKNYLFQFLSYWQQSASFEGFF